MTELTKTQVCIYMRNGIQIWIDKEKSDDFGKDLMAGMKGMVQIEGRYLNTVDIVGIFTPQDLEDLARRKQGKFKCKHGEWVTSEAECASQHGRDQGLPDYIKDAPIRKGISDKTRASLLKGL